MAWFDRNPGGKKIAAEEQRDPVPTPHEPVASSPAVEIDAAKPTEAQVVAYLYKGSRVTGQMTFHGPANIDGNVDGEIQCHGTLTIGEGAEVRARISGWAVVIHGRVEGNVAAKEKVELMAPARLLGNINTARLIIAEGAVFDGDCSMGQTREKGGLASAQSVSAEKASGVKSLKADADLEK